MKKGYAHLPLIVGLLFFTIGMIFFIDNSIQRCEGHIIYGLDDAYIHLALADCLASDGTWGFVEGQFASSSSSPLWTLLLTAIMFFTTSEMIPLFLNLIFGCLLIVYLHYIYRKAGIRTFYSLLSIVSVIAFTSLFSLTMIGMEHLLHLLIMIIFIYMGADALEKDDDYWKVVAIAPFLGSVRYEGLFTIIAMAMVMFAKKRWKWALLTLTTGFLPVLIVGYISHVNGWPFLPAGVVTKTELSQSNTPDIKRFLFHWVLAIGRLKEVWPILILGGIPTLVAVRQKKFRGRDLYFSIILTLTFFAHMHTSRTGWLFRYEAYLIGGSIVAFTLGIDRLLRNGFRWFRYMCIGMSFFALMLLFDRFRDNHEVLFWSCQNIYQQQYQAAKFIDAYYEGSNIVINDIGAPLWLADFFPIDGAGLASREFIMVRFTNPDEYSSQMLRVSDSLDAEIAILYSHFIPQGSNWIRCGSHVISNNMVCGADSVIFLAIKPEAEKTLRRNFRLFSPYLPPEVQIRY